ncbi:hypothetical protein, partial [Chromobacterium haemolyticum]|uniref:hypothetical protein n=1 Tax=Chromobacterium haemolyticum TaxID=394935 RepID=UPI001C38AE4A
MEFWITGEGVTQAASLASYTHSITHKSPPLGYHPFLKNERCHSGVGGGGNGGCGSRRSSAEL